MAHQGGPGTGSLGGPPSGHVRDIFSYGARAVVACSALSIRILLYPHWALAERARVPSADSDREARASPSHELSTVYDAADCDIRYRTTSGLSTVLHLRSLQ